MNRRELNARRVSLRKMAEAARPKPPRSGVLALYCLIAVIVAVGPLTLRATQSIAPSPTPAGTAAVSASPAPTTGPQVSADVSATPEFPAEGPTPTISFDPMATPIPPEEFFDGDGTGDVADYDNPAYTYDDSDDPDTDGGSAIAEFLDELMAENSQTVDLVIVLTLIALVPSLLLMLTGFTRIVIVLSFTRNAMGTQSMPPNQVMIGLALMLTLFLMFPILTDINTYAVEPYLAEEITLSEAGERAMEPIKDFMIRQIWQDDLDLFCEIGGVEQESLTLNEAGILQVPTHILIPTFLVGELRTAFWMGFLIYVPFIVIDMIVASTLMSMGMMMLPPVMISMPFKILLFVSVDGWRRLIETLLTGFY